MLFHADPSDRPTVGRRGKTTHRNSTHTVRGPEGSYIAQTKEELACLPKVPSAPMFRVRDESHHPQYPSEGIVGGSTRLMTRDEAEAYADKLRRISGTQEANGWVYTDVRVVEG